MCGNLGLLLVPGLLLTLEQQLELTLVASASDVNLDVESALFPTPPLLTTLLNTAGPPPTTSLFTEPLLPLLPPLSLVTDLCKLTEMRGGQAAGLASASWTANPANTQCVRARAIVAKRSTGARTMAKSWTRAARSHTRVPSILLQSPSVLLMGHLRFATSSRNKESETHPHIWLPWRKESAWVPSFDAAKGALTLVHHASCMTGHMLTHNGDFDAVRIYDNAPLPQADVGQYLSILLSHTLSVDSDSAKIAGYFDLFSTKGRWCPSARAAWVLTISKSVRDVLEHATPTKENVPFPGPGAFQRWGVLFEQAFIASNLASICPITQREQFATTRASLQNGLVATLSQNPTTCNMGTWLPDKIALFVSTTITNFFTADAATCMSTFLRSAVGSFGLAVTAATEEGSVVVAALGQPMAVSLDPMVPLVLYGSEVSAVRIPVQDNFAPLRYRYNIDDCEGEVVRVGKTGYGRVYNDVMWTSQDSMGGDVGPVVMRISSSFSNDFEISFDKLCIEDDMDPMENLVNSFSYQQCAAIVPPVGDLVLDDLNDIPQTMREITLDWGEGGSTNRMAANDFVHLFAETRLRHSRSGGGIDLLITGIESSLWLGEQLAADFKIVFPNINVVVASANKLLGALEDVPRMVHFCGYNRVTSEQLQNDRPVVLCISQSGQTFATLHATRQLLSILGGNVFLVTGQADTKMREAVIDTLGSEAGIRRVIYNHSNLRVAEPSTVATCAMHHTLTEFLLYVSQCCCVMSEESLQMSVIRDDLVDFRDLVDCLHDDLPELVVDSSRTNRRLVAQGQRWALHITESWRAMVLSGLYIMITVVSGYPLFSLALIGQDSPAAAVVYAVRVLDAVLFIMLPKVFSYLLRILEGRTVLARQGKRTLVICDVPWVHQNLENYVTKLFALSYSFLNVEVHGTCAHDDMVHNFTHRVSRGTLLAVGRPDGRVLSLLKTEQTIMLAVKQAAFIENMGVGPEIFTVGHNNVKSSIASQHVCVPSTRRKFLSESLYDFALAAKTSSLEQKDFGNACGLILSNLYTQSVKLGPAYPRRMLTVGVCHAKEEKGEKPVVDDVSSSSVMSRSGGSSSGWGFNSRNGKTPPGSALRRRAASTGSLDSNDDHAEEVLAMTAARGALQVSIDPNISVEERGGERATPRPGGGGTNGNFFLGASNGGSDKGMEEELLRGDPLQGSKHASLNLSLNARYAFASRLPLKVRRKLDKTQTMEHLFESRVASFERYVSMLVMFHSVAKKCSRAWGWVVGWDISRSQSNLRVATTACPVSVEEDDEGEDLVAGSVFGSAAASADDLAMFEGSKHTVEDSKERVGGLEDLGEFFPASIVNLEEESMDKSKRGSGAGAGSSGEGLQRARMNRSIPLNLNELEFVKRIGGGGGRAEEETDEGEDGETPA